MSEIRYGVAISLAYHSGDEGGIMSSCKLFLPAVATCRGGGGGGSAPCAYTTYILKTIYFLRKKEIVNGAEVH
jgi:hypothetical protein